MIIYEDYLGKFINQCYENTIVNIIKENMIKKGYNIGGKKEIDSWNNSLPVLAKALNDDSISKDINVAIEYKIDMTNNRIDFLLYGRDKNDINNLIIMELKQWSSVKDSNKPNFIYAFGGGGHKDYLHPSY